MSDSFDDLGNPAEDPEIAALLEFEPVPRAYKQRGAWTPELQRLLIGRMAQLGSVRKACEAMQKDRGGALKLYKSSEATTFRDSWDGALALWEERNGVVPDEPFVGEVPIAGRSRKRPLPGALPQAEEGELGQVRNECGEWEDADSYARRGEEAGESIAMKLLRIRRLYLQEISSSPGKRAAFEILTELPIDWEIAERGEPQPDEPYNRAKPRQPDMILTAESGWALGEIGYGPDKKAAARRAIDEHRAEQGLQPVDWSGEGGE